MKDITFEGKLLSEYIKDQEELELERDIKKYNIETSSPLYRKSSAKIKSKKERNGVVRKLQNEINFRNRDSLVTNALKNDLMKDAMVYWLIGCYKETRITSQLAANDFERIIKENKIKTKYKNIFAAFRSYLGRLRKTEFARKYVKHVRDFKNGNYFYLINDGYNLTPEKAIELAYIIDSEIKAIQPIEKEIAIQNPVEVKPIKKENNLTQEIIERIGIDLADVKDKTNLAVNIFGPINIYLRE